MRKTKIVTTIGPASESEKAMTELILAGANVIRCNMSHGGHDEQAKRIATARKLSKKLNKQISILVDTKGPEVRLRTFKDGAVELKDGEVFVFNCEDKDIEGTEKEVSVSYKNLYKDLHEGNIVLVNDGLLEFEVLSVEGKKITTRIVKGGKVSDKKGMNFPDLVLSLPFISPADKEDLIFAAKQNADYVAASFISNANNVKEMRKLLNDNGGERIEIISKIENSEGVRNLDEIIEVSEGVMVARGDMGVEIPLERLPGIQKEMIKKAQAQGKIVVTATEMLETMIKNLRPTRAEASDVANAVYDGTGAVMLSGETAMGAHPPLVVKTMAKIAREAEQNINYGKRFRSIDLKATSIPEAIAKASCDAAIDLEAKLIVAFTKSGSTAKMVSRFRPPCPILACTIDKDVATGLGVQWGVTATLVSKYNSTDELFEVANDIAKKEGNCVKGDKVVVTAGMPIGNSDGTNIFKIITIK